MSNYDRITYLNLLCPFLLLNTHSFGLSEMTSLQYIEKEAFADPPVLGTYFRSKKMF